MLNAKRSLSELVKAFLHGWPLDGAGKKQSGDTNVPPVELEFRPYETKDWSTLAFANLAIWATDEEDDD